ncbi:MAG: hypothetical protein IH899_14470 [Planctomycetes bacterium]|nr:hypothetical protein [Planctomycetota bacterium]
MRTYDELAVASLFSGRSRFQLIRKPVGDFSFLIAAHGGAARETNSDPDAGRRLKQLPIGQPPATG